MTDAPVAPLDQRALLDALEQKGLLGDRASAESLLARRAATEYMPFYLRFLAGVGAVIGATMFIGFLAAVDIIDFDRYQVMLAWGIAFAVAGVFLHRAIHAEDGTIAQSFSLQTSFLLVVAGKGMIAAAAAAMFDSEWAIAVAFAVATAVTFRAYPVDFERFLSAFASGLAVIVNVLWLSSVDSALRPLAIDAFFLAALLAAVWLSCHRASGQWLRPIHYAVLATLATLVALIEFGDGQQWLRVYATVDRFMSASIAAALIALVYSSARERRMERAPPILAAYLVTIALGAISAPGVLLGIGLLVLGHARRDSLLVPAGALFLAVFIFFHYYSLNLSLAEKSGVLFASGAVLLLAYGVMRALRWDRGN